MNVLKALTLLAATLGIGTSPITSADPADSFCDEPRAAAGWHYEVFASGLPRADNIAVGAEGEVYVSLEVGKGEGQVVRLRDGRRQIVAEGLSRPDGLALTPTHLYVTEEVWRGRLIRVDLADMSWTVLARLNKPEGVDILPDGSLVVAEDYPGGRLLRVTGTGEVSVLLKGLARPEGVAVAPDGGIYVAETMAGRVIEVTDHEARVVVAALDEPDQVAVAPDGGLWITEDRPCGRLLRHHAGQLRVIVEGLAFPQGIAFGANGEVYVAEQDRDRVLTVRSVDARP